MLVAKDYGCQYELISTACRRGPRHADVSARGSEVKSVQIFRLRRSACSKRLRNACKSLGYAGVFVAKSYDCYSRAYFPCRWCNAHPYEIVLLLSWRLAEGPSRRASPIPLKASRSAAFLCLLPAPNVQSRPCLGHYSASYFLLP